MSDIKKESPNNHSEVSYPSPKDDRYATHNNEETEFWTAARRQYGVIVIVNMVTFLFGASQPTASISLPRLPENISDMLNGTSWPKDFVVTSDEGEWITRVWLLSHIVSGLVSNSVAEIFGRKKSLMIDCLAFLIGYLLYGIGEDVTSLCVARAFLGYPLVNTVYLFELIQLDMRGLGAAAFAFMFALGGTTMAFLGAAHPFWRLNMIAMAVVSFLAMILIATILTESPIWLLRKGKITEAEEAMRRNRGDIHHILCGEFTEMKDLYVANMKKAKLEYNRGKTWSLPLREIMNDILKCKKKPPKFPFSFLFLSILFAFIGWTGITFIALNGPRIFKNQSGDLGIDQYYMNFIVSLAKIPGGLFAALFLKRFSTRPVFLASAVLIAAAHVTMGLTNMAVLPSGFAMAAIATIQFASSGGYISVSYLLLGVLLPSSSRSTFTGLVATVEGLSALSLNALRPYISEAIGDSGLFFVFAAVVLLCIVFMFIWMPETKGYTMEQIEYIFLCPRHEGCTIRRDPNEVITMTVETMQLAWTQCIKCKRCTEGLQSM